jgi:hypothetical protein
MGTRLVGALLRPEDGCMLSSGESAKSASAFSWMPFICVSSARREALWRRERQVLTFLSDGYFFPEIVRRCERYDACCDHELLHAGSGRGIEDAGRTGDSGLEQRQRFGEVREGTGSRARG